MNRRLPASGILACALSLLLVACGPSNTLALHGKGKPDARLGAVESNLRKVQKDVKELQRKQAQTDVHLAELQKKFGVSPSVAARNAPPEPLLPKASALGQGFVRPADTETTPATAPDQPAPAAPATPAAPTAPAAVSPAAQLVPPQSNAAALHGARTALLPPPLPAPAQTPPVQLAATQPTPAKTAPLAVRPPAAPVPTPKAPSKLPAVTKPHRGKGWIGPPSTPEAAIAADRKGGATPVTHRAPENAAPATTATPASPLRPTAVAAAPPTATPAKPTVAIPTKPTATPPHPTPAVAAPVSPAPAPAPKNAPAAKPAPAPVGKAQFASAAEKNAYNAALQMAINGRQAEAKAAFNQFLTAHPQSPLTPYALYWLGEGAAQRGDNQAALADFEKVAKGWPGHHKAADSLYKIAQLQEKSGKFAAARTTLERYLRDYPNAALAGAARQKLQALPK